MKFSQYTLEDEVKDMIALQAAINEGNLHPIDSRLLDKWRVYRSQGELIAHINKIEEEAGQLMGAAISYIFDIELPMHIANSGETLLLTEEGLQTPYTVNSNFIKDLLTLGWLDLYDFARRQDMTFKLLPKENIKTFAFTAQYVLDNSTATDFGTTAYGLRKKGNKVAVITTTPEEKAEIDALEEIQLAGEVYTPIYIILLEEPANKQWKKVIGEETFYDFSGMNIDEIIENKDFFHAYAAKVLDERVTKPVKAVVAALSIEEVLSEPNASYKLNGELIKARLGRKVLKVLHDDFGWVKPQFTSRIERGIAKRTVYSFTLDISAVKKANVICFRGDKVQNDPEGFLSDLEETDSLQGKRIVVIATDERQESNLKAYSDIVEGWSDKNILIVRLTTENQINQWTSLIGNKGFYDLSRVNNKSKDFTRGLAIGLTNKVNRKIMLAEGGEAKGAPTNWIDGKFNTEKVPDAKIADLRFEEKVEAAFKGKRAVTGLIGFGSEELDFKQQAQEYIDKNPGLGFTVDEIVGKLETAKNFLDEVWLDGDDGTENPVTFENRFIVQLAAVLLKIKNERSELSSKLEAIVNYCTNKQYDVFGAYDSYEELYASELKKLFLNGTRFVTFLFQENEVWDPYLFKEDAGIVLHTGSFPFKGSENIKGGARSIYQTLGRILGYAEYPDRDEAIKAFRALITHEFKDLVRGKHKDEDKTTTRLINKVNKSIKANHALALKEANATMWVKKTKEALSRPKSSYKLNGTLIRASLGGRELLQALHELGWLKPEFTVDRNVYDFTLNTPGINVVAFSGRTIRPFIHTIDDVKKANPGKIAIVIADSEENEEELKSLRRLKDLGDEDVLIVRLKSPELISQWSSLIKDDEVYDFSEIFVNKLIKAEGLIKRLAKELNSVARLRLDINRVGLRISEADEAFYNNITSDDISSEIDKYGILVSFKDVVENLAGFKSQISKLGNLPIVIVTKDESERKKINKLKEYGFLPENITIVGPLDKVTQDEVSVLEGRKIIALGFKDSFEEGAMELNMNITNFEMLREVHFKALGKNELLNWDRVAALIGVYVGKYPASKKTVLDKLASPPAGNDASITDFAIEDMGIDNAEVGVAVTENILEDAKRAYEDLKTNI